MIPRLSSIPWCGINRILAETVAFWGNTLHASDPLIIVKATVVRIMAPACALIIGRTFSSTGRKSHRLENTSFSGKPAYGASVLNIVATSFGILRRKTGFVSVSFTNAASLATGECAFGALAWPPSEAAVKRTSALPFSNTPTMAKLP